MTFRRPKTAVVAVLGVSALVFASIGVADAQQKYATSTALDQLAEKQIAEEMVRRAAEIERALAMEQQVRVRPTIRLGGFFESRSGRMAARVLSRAEELELTEAQQETIRNAERSHRRDEIRRGADIEIAELELAEMMEADTLDLNAIETHMRQVASLEVDERMASLRLDRTVRDALTPEQIDKLEEMSPERMLFETYQRQRNR